jgi:hypothetical protein
MNSKKVKKGRTRLRRARALATHHVLHDARRHAAHVRDLQRGQAVGHLEPHKPNEAAIPAALFWARFERTIV